MKGNKRIVKLTLFIVLVLVIISCSTIEGFKEDVGIGESSDSQDSTGGGSIFSGPHDSPEEIARAYMEVAYSNNCESLKDFVSPDVVVDGSSYRNAYDKFCGDNIVTIRTLCRGY